MKKMISIAALSLVIAVPAFAQDAKPATGAMAPAAPMAAKPDAAKTGDVKATAPTAPVIAQTAPAATTPASPAMKPGDAPKVDASKTAQPAAAPAPAAAPVMTDKKAAAPMVDTKPMAIGAPKMDDKKLDAKTGAANTTAPADVKKQ